MSITNIKGQTDLGGIEPTLGFIKLIHTSVTGTIISEVFLKVDKEVFVHLDGYKQPRTGLTNSLQNEKGGLQ